MLSHLFSEKEKETRTETRGDTEWLWSHMGRLQTPYVLFIPCFISFIGVRFSPKIKRKGK